MSDYSHDYSKWCVLNQRLLPCPMCGGKAHLANYYFGEKTEVVVECENSECLMAVRGSSTRKEAIKRWNSRAEDTELKVCPFCGSHASLVRYEAEYEDEHDLYEVKCSNKKCHACTVTYSDAKDVKTIWNRRKK